MVKLNSKTQNRTPIALILPDIRSAMNVGAIFRTADAVRAEKIYLTGYTATPEHPKVAKTAIGAENSVPWTYNNDVLHQIHKLKEVGYQIVSLEKTSSATEMSQAIFKFPLALVVGNEISGINREILEESDIVVYLPMLGDKESLNVATATGIALYKLLENYQLANKK